MISQPPPRTKVDEILDAGEKRIRAAGYHGFSFRDLSNDVSMRTASIHYHFPTKPELGAALVQRYGERALAAVDAAIEAGAAPLEAWKTLFRDAALDPAGFCLAATLSATLPGLPPSVAQAVRDFYRAALARLSAQGLSETEAAKALSRFAGAMMLAHATGDPALFERATAPTTPDR